MRENTEQKLPVIPVVKNRIYTTVSSCLCEYKAAFRKFIHIGGLQLAGAFAYSAVFALFPFILLCLTIASIFINNLEVGGTIISYFEQFVPLTGEAQAHVFGTLNSMASGSGRAGLAAFIMLIFATLQFFTNMAGSVNQAWGLDAKNWWNLPFKSVFFMIAVMIILLVGATIPLTGKIIKTIFLPEIFISWITKAAVLTLPWIFVFTGLLLFYKLAPVIKVKFSEVWFPALTATIMILTAEILFILYLKHSTNLNAVYGAFGSIMALLLWIYISGCIFIYNACLCSLAGGKQVQIKP